MTEIEIAMLRYLWSLNASSGGSSINWREWATEEGFDISDADNAFYLLKERDLVDAAGAGSYVELTIFGQKFVEDNQLVANDLIAEHLNFRTQFIVALGNARDVYSLNHMFDYREILEETGLSDILFRANIDMLVQGGYVEWVTSGSLKITTYGYDAVRVYRAKAALVSELERLQSGTTTTPQQRGHELEKLLEQAASSEGWRVERNARAPGEENDLIISRDLNYFIVSCKWEAAPIGVEAVRNLRDRVTHRPTSRGILMSMSGFAKTSIEDVSARLESAVILLFGPDDIESSLTGEFTELLTEKLHSAMVNRTFPNA